MKLYEITDALRAIIARLAETAAALDDDPDCADAQRAHAEAEAAYEAVGGDLRDKLRAYCAYALELRVEREARQAKMDAIVGIVLEPMRRQNERDEKQETWLLDTVKATIALHDVALPLKYDEFRVALQKLPAKVGRIDADLLPDGYWRAPPAPPREPDKRAILDDLKEGVVVPGASLAPLAYKLVIK